MGLPQSSTQGQSDAGRTPRRHTDTAERWVSPKARRGDSRTPGELLAGIPTPRNDGSLPKLDAGTAQCSARRQRSPRQHTGLAEQRDSPRRSRCTRRAHDVSTPAQVVPPPKAATRAPRFHARPRAAPHRPADSPPARRYAHLTSFLQHKRTRTYATCSRLILRPDTNRRRRDHAFKQLHVPGARGAHQHEGFPTNL